MDSRPPGDQSGGSFGVWIRVAIVAAAVVLAAVLVGQELALRRGGVAAPPPLASPSAVASPSPSVSPVPAATPSPSMPPLVAFESQVLSYRIELPLGYRRSDCLSAIGTGEGPRQAWLGGDTFTMLSVQQERALDRAHVGRGGRVAMWTFSVTVFEAGNLSAIEFAERGGCPACDRSTAAQAGEHVESLLLGGQEAARSTSGGEARRYVVKAGDRLYNLELYSEPLLAGGRPGVVPVGILDAVAATFRTDQPRPLPTPTPRPQTPPPAARTAAQDIADALETPNFDQLAARLTPHCWLEVSTPSGGPIGRAVEPYLAELGKRMAEGLRIRVDRSVEVANEDGPGALRFFMRSQWTEAGRTTELDLYLREIEGRWYWGGLALRG